MATGRTAEEQIREAAWKYTGWFVLLAAMLLAGLFVGYQLWGEKVLLEQKVATLESQVHELRSQREDLKTKLAVETRDKEKAEQALEQARTQLRQAQAAPATPLGAP